MILNNTRLIVIWLLFVISNMCEMTNNFKFYQRDYSEDSVRQVDESKKLKYFKNEKVIS